ncbi:transketolase [bacterium]|nr:transketolase [bacterium]
MSEQYGGLKKTARDIRAQALERAYASKLGHLGGTFSAVELLVALYKIPYIRNLGHDGDSINRDRFILSKGHACLALYPILLDLGLIDSEKLDSYGRNGGLGGQLDISIPGVDWNTGSLGHAVGIGCGMALGVSSPPRDIRIITLLGDAELSEGSVWEAIAFAGDFALSGLTVIVDRNRLAVTSEIGDDSIYKELGIKLDSFGWSAMEIDGHSFPEIDQALSTAVESNRPTLIVANTVKGRGVSFMERNLRWHHGAPSAEEYKAALEDLSFSTEGA